MALNNIFPNSIKNFGIKSLLSNQYMLAFFKKFCDEINNRMWRLKKARNAKYEKNDFLKVFFFSEIIGRSIHDASELLNEYYLSHKRGRRKIFADGRNKRLVPHQTEVNKFLRRIRLERARNILRECVFYQLKEAKDLNIISRKVNVLIDFTEHPYYGIRTDKMIKGTNRQKGTTKMRHYLAFSILSRNTQLFAGLEHVAGGQSKIPIILKFLDHLISEGFELRYILMDREFYRAALIDEVKRRGGNVLIPAKAYKTIKVIIAQYLQNKGARVRKYMFSTAPGGKYRTFRQVYLILNAKKGHSLLDVKRAFQKGALALDDARKLIYAIMTTQKPRGRQHSWASRTSRFYRKRWLIETGFSDLNRIHPRWKTNYDDVRYLDMLVRMLLYNSWKINKTIIKNYAKKEGKRKKWKLIQNQDYLKRLFLSLEKKSLG